MVADTGIGMPPDQIAGLFRAFTQGDGTPSRAYDGAGIGLALSDQICHQLGGQLAATSAAGQGSQFRFWLPLGDQSAPGSSR